MAELDFVALAELESARFADALAAADLDATVPTCPDWSGADLAWHLAEVQNFWASIVARLLVDPGDVKPPRRPPDHELTSVVRDRARALVTALRERYPNDTCWSWFEGGRHVGWVARRQAHEALIHRVDAELVAGSPVADVDPAFAADGVDEMIGVMLGGGIPDWASFESDGAAIRLETTDTSDSWSLEFGRFSGTSPTSGNTYDLDDARPCEDPDVVDATVSGRAWDLDRWLWGRTDESALTVTGDGRLVSRLRAVLAEATQ
jgi:uncharacterized protein (TIGR03083 family)